MSKKQKENNTIISTVEKVEEKTPTPFKTVGTVRLSKSGNAISIKLFPENRFLHISKRDIELILIDKNNSTVANVREYEKLENLKEGKTNG
jgi:hypothetical protein